MGQKFSQQNLKVNAKMATSHLALLKSKKSNLLQTSKREVATLVSVNKIPLAEIKIESIIQQEDLIIAIEILGLHCDRILNRVSQIASQPKCPEDIFVSIATVIYCSTRLPIPEFHSIATQMALKYSKEWVMCALLFYCRYLIFLIYVDSFSKTSPSASTFLSCRFFTYQM
uniref:Uncharacterized protein n=1 Tax=Spongospora subterranea TaxID=70186 RepID=A0A0H5QIP9_9EUKA|eukprot:CRZ01863.1 hypothetical protein [Spongospora subterranea]